MAPRVTALVEERRDRVRVELDGEAWRSLPVAAVVGAQLRVGTELDRPRARELRRELRRLEAVEIAAGALGRSDRSRAGLEELLERRGILQRDRARAVETLERAGYVDDTRFAAGRAGVLAARGYGDRAIRFDLERRGVAAEEIEAALSGLPGEVERLLTQLERAGAEPKAARRFGARGFSAESIESALAAHHEPP